MFWVLIIMCIYSRGIESVDDRLGDISYRLTDTHDLAE